MITYVYRVCIGLSIMDVLHVTGKTRNMSSFFDTTLVLADEIRPRNLQGNMFIKQSQ